jgi:hypothetical protein
MTRRCLLLSGEFLHDRTDEWTSYSLTTQIELSTGNIYEQYLILKSYLVHTIAIFVIMDTPSVNTIIYAKTESHVISTAAFSTQ